MQDRKKIKITHITRFAYPHIGGLEAVVEQINECLPDEEFEKEVFCCSNTEKSSVENGVRYHRFRYLFDFAANSISPQLFFGMVGLKTDVIHFHMPVIQNVVIWFILYHLGLLKYKKMIITYHGAIIGYDKFMKPFWRLYEYFFKKADIIHVLSPTTIDSDKYLLNNREKCIVIPFGVNLNEEYSIEKYNDIKNKYKNKKIFMCVGRIVKLKGFNFAIKAIQNINNAILLIMGDGPLKEEYSDYVNKNQLNSKVEFLGTITDKKIKNAYFKACDVLIVPSIRTESFGITQLEAMLFSHPVINTKLGTGLNYVSVDKITGLTVEPKNVEELTNAINVHINNKDLCQEYGNNARKRVEDLFDISKIQSEYTKLYEIN